MAARVVPAGAEVTIVVPPVEANPHLHAFDEVSASLAEALGSGGHRVRRATQVPGDGTSILFAAHLYDDEAVARLPASTIVYNLEQIDDGSMMPPDRLASFGHVTVWDYSERNVDAWRAAGVDAALARIGWSPGLARLDRSVEADIDVLFYGSINERRRRVLEQLHRAGARVEAAFGVYGEERDRLVARSRAVINIQHYEARILEMVRLSYLFANAVPVITEFGPGIDGPDWVADAAVTAPYERLVASALAILDADDALRSVGAQGRSEMEAWPWSRTLEGLVDFASPAHTTGEPAWSPASPADDAAPVGLVLVCRPGNGPAGGDPVADLVGRVTTEIFELAGTRRDAIGPPPDLSSDAVAAVADRAATALAEAWSGDGCEVRDDAAGVILPFWSAVASEAGVELSVRLEVTDPREAAVGAEDDAAALEAVLAWIGTVGFTELESRTSPRTVVLVPSPSAATRPLGTSPRLVALDRAEELHRALAATPPDEGGVEAVLSAYLEAMAWFLPMLSRRA